MSVSFDQLDLADAIQQLTPGEIDALPFGTIRLDARGTVMLYSKAEAKLSGFGSRPVMGLTFFTEIAPCMNSENFRAAVELAINAGTFSAEFTHIGDFDDRDRELTVKAQSSGDGGIWIFLHREGE